MAAADGNGCQQSDIAVTIYNVSADQIDTPRVITKQDQTIVWRWDTAEAFGATAPDQNPSSLGTFAYYLAFPGQTRDIETGLFQNWNRDYDAKWGRYTQSDPIGQRGGINTYLYATGNAITFFDPRGLAVKCKTVAKIPLIGDLQECTEDGSTPSEQDARNAKRMSSKELDKACRANGYEDAHAMKRDLGLDSKSDIFVDGNGNMYSGPRKGSGLPQYLRMNTRGIVPRP